MVRVQLEKIEEYAETNRIPIMQKDGIDYLTSYIKDNHIKNILEIGSAIGYSAIKMCLVDHNVKVTTIERDEIRYQEAIKNIELFHLEDRITIIFDDAFNVDLNDRYDLIFIDAAKSQYIKFFEKFQVNLNHHGVIISDNLNFHGLTHTKEPIASRNVRGIVRKLNCYIDYLNKNNQFTTTFLDIGDGIAVSKINE